MTRGSISLGGVIVLRIAAAIVAAVFWGFTSMLCLAVAGRDPVDVLIRGGGVEEVGLTIAVMLAAISLYALAARYFAGRVADPAA